MCDVTFGFAWTGMPNKLRGDAAFDVRRAARTVKCVSFARDRGS